MFLKQKPVLIDFFPVNIHKYLADEGYFTLPYFRPKQKNKTKKNTFFSQSHTV